MQQSGGVVVRGSCSAPQDGECRCVGTERTDCQEALCGVALLKVARGRLEGVLLMARPDKQGVAGVRGQET